MIPTTVPAPPDAARPPGPPRRWWPWLAGSAVALAVDAVAVALGPHLRPHVPLWVGVALLGLAWTGFAVAVLALRRVPVRAAVPLVLIGALALVAAGAGPPRSSDDLYRYVWDGRVQLSGVDAYRYAPAAPELAGLREDGLWPARGAWCVAPGTLDDQGHEVLTPGCTRINRPTVHTIYPPVAQVLFVGVAALAPAGSGTGPIQLAAVLIALATTVLLVYGLRRRGGDPRRAALWAWCPTVAIEAASNAHVDVAGALLTAAALLVLAGPGYRSGRTDGASAGATARTTTGARTEPGTATTTDGESTVATTTDAHTGTAVAARPVRASLARALVGGAVLGLAVATKITPGLVLPAVLRRRPVAVVAALIGTVALVYLPHVVAVGAGVIGYIPGYLREEGYDSGERFALLTMLVPHTWAAPLAVLVLGAVAVGVLWRADPDQPWRGATVMAGAALLVTTPSYPWYALLLVVLVALGGAPRWLVVAAVAYLAQYGHEIGLSPLMAQRLGYTVAAVVVLAPVVVRVTRRSRPRTGSAGHAVGSGRAVDD